MVSDDSGMLDVLIGRCSGFCNLTVLCCAQEQRTRAQLDLQSLRVPWTLGRLFWMVVLGLGRPALKLSKYGGTQCVLKSVLSQLCFKQCSDIP